VAITAVQVLLYAICNNVQASYDEALRLACKSLSYPLGQGKHTTTEVSPGRKPAACTPLADIGNTVMSALGLGTRYSTRVEPSDAHDAPPGGKSTNFQSWKVKRLLRQSLAERDLVVKRAVYDLALPEVLTNLMAQTVDVYGDEVLMLEVPLPGACVSSRLPAHAQGGGFVMDTTFWLLPPREHAAQMIGANFCELACARAGPARPEPRALRRAPRDKGD
jgi:hypothetical protein